MPRLGNDLVAGGRKVTGLGAPADNSNDAARKIDLETRRMTSIASSATPTPNAGTTDGYTITALAANATFGAPTGTFADMKGLIIRIKDNGTARTLAWNAAYVPRGVALPTTTVAGKYLTVGFLYNATTSTWDCIAVAQEA